MNMTKKMLFAAALFAVAAFGFVACGDDDDVADVASAELPKGTTDKGTTDGGKDAEVTIEVTDETTGEKKTITVKDPFAGNVYSGDNFGSVTFYDDGTVLQAEDEDEDDSEGEEEDDGKKEMLYTYSFAPTGEKTGVLYLKPSKMNGYSLSEVIAFMKEKKGAPEYMIENITRIFSCYVAFEYTIADTGAVTIAEYYTGDLGTTLAEFKGSNGNIKVSADLIELRSDSSDFSAVPTSFKDGNLTATVYRETDEDKDEEAVEKVGALKATYTSAEAGTSPSGISITFTELPESVKTAGFATDTAYALTFDGETDTLTKQQ